MVSRTEEVAWWFLVHGEADFASDRLYIQGRGSTGETFALVDQHWKPALLVPARQRTAAEALLAPLGFVHDREGDLRSMDGEALERWKSPSLASWSRGRTLCSRQGLEVREGDRSLLALWQRDHQCGLVLGLEGPWKAGTKVDRVFLDPRVEALDHPGPFGLDFFSFDLETDEADGSIRTVAWDSPRGSGVLSLWPSGGPPPPADLALPGLAATLEVCTDEKNLLERFLETLRRLDPDVITGWNILDFDLPRLAERCARYGIVLNLGRGKRPCRYVAAAGRKSAALEVPGRQVLDALRIVRSSPHGFTDLRLDTVAREVLGEGKLVDQEGEQKLEALDRLFVTDPLAFAAYCLQDAHLVNRILDRTGLGDLTIRRATLTGSTLDQAWTSIASFEHWYGIELRRLGLAEPLARQGADTGAKGGTILSPQAGIFPAVLVFDYRSLYPSVIRTFGIDPLLLVHGGPGTTPEAGTIEAPNGARFRREEGILAPFVARCFDERIRALEAGDQRGAQVFKIFLNALYGVLGSAGSRYGTERLAGAITGWGAWFLHQARDWFSARGYRVLYGDTDSIFIESGLGDEAPLEHYQALARTLLDEYSQGLDREVAARWGVKNHVSLRFDKAYRRFLIPRVRHGFAEEDRDPDRGRAKGYAGLAVDVEGGTRVEIKGMEASRSDTTPLMRRVQEELAALVFHDDWAAIPAYLEALGRDLRMRRLDGELVYTKRIRRPLESYRSGTPPPQVRAALMLDPGERRRSVSYVMTREGPRPLGSPGALPDLDQVVDHQLLPLCQSLLELSPALGGLDLAGLLRGSSQYELGL